MNELIQLKSCLTKKHIDHVSAINEITLCCGHEIIRVHVSRCCNHAICHIDKSQAKQLITALEEWIKDE